MGDKTKIIVRPEVGIGDVIMTTAVLKSLSFSAPGIPIIVSVNENKKELLEGLLNENGGAIAKIVGFDYVSERSEALIDFRGYLNLNQDLSGINYYSSLIDIARVQLREQDFDFSLRRNIPPEVRFDNVKRLKEEVKKGKEKVENIKEKYGDKPIVWIAPRTQGSKNRMPQSFPPRKDFWHKLVDECKERFIFYELRAPEELPICDKVEPRQGESYSFAAQSEIIRASVAGIGLNGMGIQFAYALGKKKMVVLLGPTHPNAIIYKGSEKEMLTIPSLESFENSSYCRGCGMVGYSNIESYKKKKEVMKKRYPRFDFDFETKVAIESGNVEKLRAAPNCRELKEGEHFYDCWKDLEVKKVVEKLESLL